MKTLSMRRLLPSIDIRQPARFGRSVQTKDVNCEPWSVLKMSGAPKRWIGSFRTPHGVCREKPCYRNTQDRFGKCCFAA